MKTIQLLSLAASSSALVLPSQELMSEVQIEDNHRNAWVGDRHSILSGSKDALKKFIDEISDSAEGVWDDVTESAHNAFDDAVEYGRETADTVNKKLHETAFDAESWLDTATDDLYGTLDHGHHGHHGHHGPPNQTVYQLISESKYTTKLAKLINKYDDLVETLNSTKANYTLFAPTDKAFEKIPEDAPEPSKELLKSILQYHISPDFYPAQRVLATHTVPTLLQSDHLASGPRPQRLAFKINLRGLTVNFYSRIIAVNVYGTNGVIHGLDSLLLPPPSVIQEIDLLPGTFSTLELGLGKTGLLDQLNTTDHAGGTFFAPSNFAFQKLGPRINAFLFSQYGQKYLKALLQYHVVPKNTLYSDAYYEADSDSSEDVESIPKGRFHVDLPTLLEDRNLAVDIARYGGLIDIKVNAYSRVVVQDGIAYDGVIQVVSDVIVPPKHLSAGDADEEASYWMGEEMSVEEFKQRLGPHVPKSDL